MDTIFSDYIIEEFEPHHFDQTLRHVTIKLSGFENLSGNRLKDKLGNIMDVDLFLGTLHVSNNSHKPIVAKTGEVIATFGDNIHFRLINEGTNIVELDGSIHLVLDLTRPTDSNTIDGYIGASGLIIMDEQFRVTYEVHESTSEVVTSAKTLTQDELNYLWSLMPNWVKELPEPEDLEHPTYYGTRSREGDIEVHNKVMNLLNQTKDE